MKRKIKLYILTLLIITFSVFLFVGCSCNGNEDSVLKKSGSVYEYNFDEPYADDENVDPGMSIDGTLNEEVWGNTNFYSHSQKGVTYKVGTHFTDKGVYIAAEAIDNRIFWNGNLDFDNNSSFKFTIVGADAVNDLVDNDLASTTSHATERMFLQVDSKSMRSVTGVPAFVRAKSTETSLTVEMFISWNSLHFSEKQDQIRLVTVYRKVYAFNSVDNCWILPSGIEYWIAKADQENPEIAYPQIAYYPMNLFDENGSVSSSGSIKNTSSNTLGNSAFGFGATDNWDLTQDKQDESKIAKVTKGAQHQFIYLKNSNSKYFEFETKIKFDEDLIAKSKNAGVFVTNENFDKKIYVTNNDYRNASFGDAFKCESNSLTLLGNNSLGRLSLQNKGIGKSISLKIIKYDKQLFYFYRQEKETEYTLLSYEEVDELKGQCSVGLYASTQATFSDWNYKSYDENTEELASILDKDIYVVDLEYDDAKGQAQVSSNVVRHNDSLTLSIVPVTNYYIEKVEINEEDKTEDFMANADKCVYEYTPTSSTKISVKFTRYNAEQQNNLQKVKLSFDTVAKKVSGVKVTVYPIDEDYSNRHFYQEITSSAGAIKLNLPYKDSVWYPAGQYYVIIADDSFLHYETIITVEKSEQSESQISIQFPQEFVIQGTEGNVWTITDDKVLTIDANKIKENYSLAYVGKSLVLGEIEGTFTTSFQKAKMNFGFGYHVDSGSDSGKIGFIGVTLDGSSSTIKAVTNSMLSYLTKTNNDFNQPNSTYSKLKTNGDILTSGSNVSMTIKLVKSQSGFYLFIGKTLVNVFSYEEIGISSDQEVSLGIMTYSEADFDTIPSYTIRDIEVAQSNKEDSQGILKLTLQGGIESENDKDLYVTLTGKNRFGIERTYRDVKAVKNSDSTYSVCVDELSTENDLEYQVEFYQGKNTLRLKDGDTVSVLLKANKTTEYTVDFNEFKKDYNRVFKINGKDVIENDIALVGEVVSMPKTYIDGSVIYTLDKTASNGNDEGVIPNSDEVFEISGVYVKAYSIADVSSNMTIAQDENGYSISFPRTRGDKYVYSTDFYNGFEITATITGGRTIAELDSGFAVTDGTSRRTFLWASWTGAGLVSRDNWEQVEVTNVNFGSGLKAYNSETNQSIRIKMVYYNLIFKFYKIDGDSESYIGCLDLNENTQYNQAGWSADTPLSVGFTSWNGSKAGATFSDIVFKKLDIGSYNQTIRIEGQKEIVQKVYGVIGENARIPSVMVKNKKTYIIDDTTSDNTLEGVVTSDGSLSLYATYKLDSSFGAISNVEFDKDEDGLVIKMPSGNYLYYEDKTNAFEITTTITGSDLAPDLDSGIIITDGSTHVFFFWSSWKTFGVRSSWLDAGQDKTLTNMYGFNSTTNPSIRIKMKYDNLECKFYKIEGNEEILFATYDISSDNRGKWTSNTELHVGFASWNHYKAGATFSNIVYQKNEHEVLPEIVYVDYTINATIEGFDDIIIISDKGRLDSTLDAPKSYQQDGIIYMLNTNGDFITSIKLIEGENVLNVSYVKNFDLSSLDIDGGHFHAWDSGALGNNSNWVTHDNYIRVKQGDKISIADTTKVVEKTLMIHEYDIESNKLIGQSIVANEDSFTFTKDCAIIISIKKATGANYNDAFEGLKYEISADNVHLRNAKAVTYTINATLEGVAEPIAIVQSGFVGIEVSAPVAYQKDGIVYRLESSSPSSIILIDGENTINANYTRNFNINDLNWEVGQIDGQGILKNDLTNYYSTKGYIKVKAGDKVTVNVSNTKVIIARYSSNSYASYLGQDFIEECPTTKVFSEDCYIRISIRRNKTDSDPVMTMEEAKASVVFKISADNNN